MIKGFFTLPDLDLSQESSVDPMGLQVIWTSYGQNIFGDKLTTIANDLRVFTFNLFHNHIIYKLFQDNTDAIKQAKNKYKNWQTDADVKTGLLIFLEDLVTNVFYLKEAGSQIDIDKLGILGLSKARTAHNSNGKVVLSAYKKEGLLKNQLNLGMTGRYKGPMMNMGFFTRSFEYIPKTWEQVDKFYYNWTPAVELENKIQKLITEILLTSSKKDYPQLNIEDITKSKYWKPITEGYLSCFGTRKLPKEIKEYWQDRLGINNGAINALYKEISRLKPDEYIKHQEIFTNACKQLTTESGELLKLESIIAIEPFLSHTEFLLRFIAQPGIKKISDYETDLIQIRKEIINASHFTIPEEQTRLRELHHVMVHEGNLSNWIKEIIKYHKKVMEQRGGSAWLEIENENNIKHYFAPILSEFRNTIPKYLLQKPWLHTYYLETLRSIHYGLN